MSFEIYGAHQRTMRAFLEQQRTVIGRLFDLEKTLAPVERRPPRPVQPVSAPVEDPIGPAGRWAFAALPSPTVPSRESLVGTVLIAARSETLADEIGRAIPAAGGKPARVVGDVLLDPEALRAAIASARENAAPIHALVFAGGMGTGTLPDSLAGWREACRIDAKALFLLLQICAKDLQESHGQVLALSAMGGGFGRRPAPWHSLPAAGAASGLLKTAAIEWPDVSFRIVDFEDASAGIVAQAVRDELLAPTGEPEVGYFDGLRQVFSEYTAPQPPDGPLRLEPSGDWVLLVTGGARGITAEVLGGVLVPGMTVHLVGRAPEPAAEGEWSRGHEAGALKPIIIERMKADGQPLTPARVEKALSGILRDREIRGNIEGFRRNGATVVYHSADVREESQVADILNGIYERHGRIDMVIHGAGVIEDKLLVDKAMESFDRVFDTKADSTYLLGRLLRPESLKALALFASVAGRTGNRGQCDYAAANELVNRFGWWFRAQWPHVRVSSINWGPWESGMASAEVNRQFRERGVTPIPPKEGREFFRREMFLCPPGEEEIVAGYFTKPPMVAARPVWPLLRKTTVRRDGDGAVADWELLVPDVPAVDDHRIDEKPVIPWAGALEFMAQTVQDAWPDWHVFEALNHQQLRGIIMNDDKPLPLRVTATAREEGGEVHVDAMVFEVASTPRPCYRASFRLLPEAPDAPLAASVPATTPASVTPRVFYGDYGFHGPGFRLLHIVDGIDAVSLHAVIRPTGAGGWSWLNDPWIFHMGFLDIALQAGSFWAQWQKLGFGLPTRAARISRFGPHRVRTSLSEMRLRFKGTESQTLIFDFEIVDERGRVTMQGEDVQMACSDALLRLASQGPPV